MQVYSEDKWTFSEIFQYRYKYGNSKFLGGANAVQILKTSEDGMANFKSEELHHISSDGPNVNLKFLEQFSEKQLSILGHVDFIQCIEV